MRILSDWEELARRTGRVVPTQMARLYTAVGDKQRAIDWLEKAHEQRAYFSPLTGFEWDPLRDEPRFQALRKEMRLVD